MRGVLVVTICTLMAMPSAAAERSAKKSNDPNRMICRTDPLIGSRLQQKRTCLTAQQWEEMHRDQRNTVERVQAFKPVVGG